MKKFLTLLLTFCLAGLAAVTKVHAAELPFNETAWYPGAVATKSAQLSNTTGASSSVGIEVKNLVDSQGLASVIDLEVRRGSVSGPLVLTGKTLQQLGQSGYLTIDTLSTGHSNTYVVIASMRAGNVNQYQGAAVAFTLNIGTEQQSGSSTSTSSNNTSSGSTSPASPPVCNASTPTSAPALRITNTSTNTVALAWSSVSPVTHYALVFTRESDGAQYGSTNIGNVTSFTVNNLSGGARYSFQVFGVNDCAPGPRSNGVATGNVPGGVITTRPVGSGGQVLGSQTGRGSGTGGVNSGTATSGAVGAVLGTTGSASLSGDVIATASAVSEPTSPSILSFTAPCADQWRFYLPAMLLVGQVGLVIANELRFRNVQAWFKHGITLAITAISMGLFYWLRDCTCFEPWLWLEWVCNWFWTVAILLTLLVRAFSYGFIEEVTELLHNE